MKPSSLSFIALTLFFCFATQAHAHRTVTGTVYWDKNGNGTLNTDETGIPEVPVSNGEDVVLTDENGEYSIDIDEQDDEVFVIKPAGYLPYTNDLNLPRFHYLHKPAGSQGLQFVGIQPTGPLPSSVNFPLIKTEKVDDFSVVLLADPQPADMEEMNYFYDDIVSDLADTEGHEFGITLGDMVDGGQVALFERYAEGIAQIGIPWFHVFGNNDVNRTAESARHADDSFQATFGPATYAFNHGNAHFIILKDVIFPPPPGNVRYASGLTDEQLTFIKNDLEHVPPDKLVVVAFHIPLFGSFPEDDRRRLFQLLEDYPNTLSLAGHTHLQQFRFFDIEQDWQRLEPHVHFNVGSASGLRWSGVPDDRGIPPATMRDGTPNGYAILNIEGSSFTIDYKAANKPFDHRMSIWGPKVVPRNTQHLAQFYVNYFLGNEYTDLEYRIKGTGESWRPLRRVEEPDPHLTAVRTKWDTADEVLEGFRPLDPVESSHLWTGFVPNNLSLGEQTIEIRVKDMFGRTFTDEFVYEVVEPPE